MNKIKDLLDLTRELLDVAKDELGYINQKIVWRDNPLFSIDSKFQEDLESRRISAELRQAFEDHETPLFHDAVIEKKENGWLVVNDGRASAYDVRREEGQLNIYQQNYLTEDGAYGVFLHLFANTAWSLGYGAYHACDEGYGIAGIGAARTIFEMFVTLKYINQDRKRRLERYLEHAHVIRKLSVDAITSGGGKVPGEVIKRWQSEHSRIKQKSRNAGEPFSDYWWAGVDMEGMAKAIGHGSDCKLIYGRLSTIAHVFSTELEGYFNCIDGEGEEVRITSRLGKSNKYCEETLRIVLGFLPQIFELCLEGLEIDSPNFVRVGKKILNYVRENVEMGS